MDLRKIYLFKHDNMQWISLLNICSIGLLIISICFTKPAFGEYIAFPPPCHPNEYEMNWGKNVINDIRRDFCIYFSEDTLFDFGAAFVIAGVMANTGIDRTIQRSWQEDLRSKTTNNFLKPFNHIGGLSYYYFPIYFGLMGIGHSREHTILGNVAYHWAYRGLRTVLLAGVQQVILAPLLGSGRPSRMQDSKWTPFQHTKGVSGHALHGAIPFLTAAFMTDPPVIRTILFILSAMPGLARINFNAHYASQVLLGWSLAYLSARSVYYSDLARPCPFQVNLVPQRDGCMLYSSMQF